MTTATITTHCAKTKSKQFPTRAMFEYPEHRMLGNSLTLTLENGTTVKSDKLVLELSNTSKLTYGEICALSGDFYGTWTPISDGDTSAEQEQRFLAAFSTLDIGEANTTQELDNLRQILQQEIDGVNAYIAVGRDPSEFYSNYSSNTELAIATILRTKTPSYALLASLNWDHFGQDAHVAYAAGHSQALYEASRPGGSLRRAYAMNAFADHFLQDAFSAGHVRTPRRQMHDGTIFADLCAQLMHDEECSIGLDVRSRTGNRWLMYGDKRLSDRVDATNAALVAHAIQTSADEVYQAWKTTRVPARDDFAVWSMVPDLEEAMKGQALSPLFRWNPLAVKIEMRDPFTDRQSTKYTTSFTWIEVYLAAQASGLWKYPIKL